MFVTDTNNDILNKISVSTQSISIAYVDNVSNIFNSILLDSDGFSVIQGTSSNELFKVTNSGTVSLGLTSSSETKIVVWDSTTKELGYKEFQSESLYSISGTLSSDRLLNGDAYFMEFLNLRYFSLGADPQDGDAYGIGIGNNNGTASSLAGIIIGGVGKVNGVVISGLSDGLGGTGSYGIKLAGNNSDPSGDDISISPENGKIKIENLPTDNTATQVLALDSDGRLCWRDVSSL
jgi:hypothetical protein